MSSGSNPPVSSILSSDSTAHIDVLCHDVGIEQARFRTDHGGDRKHPAPDSSYHAISPFALPPRGGHQMTRGIQCNRTGIVLDLQELMRKGMVVTPSPRAVRLRGLSVPGEETCS